MKLPIQSTALLAAVIFQIGCSDSVETDLVEDIGSELSSDIDSSEQTSMLAPDSDPSNAPVVLSQFNGNYLKACAFDEEDAIWETVELSIQDDVATSTITEYSDAECIQSTSELVTTVSIQYPSGTVVTDIGEANLINTTEEISMLNGESVTTNSGILYDLVLLDGTNLYFGLFTDELSGDSAETRPNQMDVDTVFVRL